LNIPAVTIDPASITNLSESIKTAVEAKFNELIAALNNDSESTMQGNITVNHGQITVSGEVDVNGPEILARIKQMIEDKVNEKLRNTGVDNNTVGENQSPVEGPGGGDLLPANPNI
jgi:hypothetical protein